CMITPPQMKPMPVTTPAAIGVGLISGFRNMMRCEINPNPAAPRASRACVRMPALLWCHCRSTPITAPRTRASRFRTASSSSDPGVISGALLFIVPEFHLGAAAQGFVVGVVTLGALAGALLGGAMADGVGRRPTNIAGGATFIVGSLVSAAAPDVATLIVGRFV